MSENICCFVQHQANTEPMNVLHFVLETQAWRDGGRRVNACHMMCLVLRGTAQCRIGAYVWEVQAGDLFIIPQAQPYAFSCGEDFHFMYMSCLGSRANQQLDRLNVSAANCVFHDCGSLEPLWRSGLETGGEALALRSESILLYSFSELLQRQQRQTAADAVGGEQLLRVKKYVDDHFSDPELSLLTIADVFSYNAKYLSAAFKRTFRMNFTAYLNVIRIQHACTLMEQSFTCVKDIAALCGYRDAMYFSRVFRARMGVSPRAHCLSLAGRLEKPMNV